MSELKVHRFITTDELFQEANAGALYYAKSEADKVIADLEESHKMEVGQLLIEIVELKEQVHEYALGSYILQARAEKEARHNKYKRCLNKAEWCEERSARYDALQEHSGFSWRREIDFYFRWYQRWLELAEKFKPNKEAK